MAIKPIKPIKNMSVIDVNIKEVNQSNHFNQTMALIGVKIKRESIKCDNLS